MTPEEKKIYMKEYRLKNKLKIQEQRKKHRLEKKKEIAEYNKKYYQEKDKFSGRHKTEKGIKIRRIGQWKRWNIKSDDFDELYDKYINTKNCELCNVELTEDKITTKTTRCLDHNHETGEFRNILCWNCNINVVR